MIIYVLLPIIITSSEMGIITHFPVLGHEANIHTDAHYRSIYILCCNIINFKTFA